MHIGYVVKRYPRFSETFVVNEILAHERAGFPITIFAVRRVNEPFFQSALGDVRSPVRYVSDSAPRAEAMWAAFRDAALALPNFWSTLDRFRDEALSDVLQGVQLALAARAEGITHLHAHFATVACSVARIAARFADIAYSVTAHAKDIFHDDVDVENLRRKLVDAVSVVTVSDFNHAYLTREHGLEPSQVCRIYNGLSLDEFRFVSPVHRARRIVSVGRLVEKKGLSFLIEACALLRRQGVDFSCTIIGDGPLRGELQQRIDDHALNDWVRLVGALPRPEVVRELQSSAVSALPCVVADDGDRDGLPTALLEAMALGTPCVSTDVTGIPEIIRHLETGWCVPQRDPEALATALSSLLTDPARRERLATNARKLIESDFDIDHNAVRLRSLFVASAVPERTGPDRSSLPALG